MDAARAYELLSCLADGINPLTGEVLPQEDSCNQAEIVRALHTAVSELKRAAEKSKKPQPENAGKPWTEADDMVLAKMFDAGKSPRELSVFFKRSGGAIATRLVRLGKIRNSFDFR